MLLTEESLQMKFCQKTTWKRKLIITYKSSIYTKSRRSRIKIIDCTYRNRVYIIINNQMSSFSQRIKQLRLLIHCVVSWLLHRRDLEWPMDGWEGVRGIRPRPLSLCRDTTADMTAARTRLFSVPLPGDAKTKVSVQSSPFISACTNQRASGCRTCRVLRSKGEYFLAPLAGLSPTPRLTSKWRRFTQE
jgi:hypothetical protein